MEGVNKLSYRPAFTKTLNETERNENGMLRNRALKEHGTKTKHGGTDLWNVITKHCGTEY